MKTCSNSDTCVVEEEDGDEITRHSKSLRFRQADNDGLAQQRGVNQASFKRSAAEA